MMSARNKDNQIQTIKNYIKAKDKILIINELNEKISSFYLYVIEYFVKLNNCHIIFNDNPKTNFQDNFNLFKTQNINLYYQANEQKIKNIISNSNKSIIFTNYKNFKKFISKYESINSYQYEKDLIIFLKSELNIDNNELIFSCKNNPHLIFSETSKFLINNINYYKDIELYERNHLIEIRKLIFDLKKTEKDIKKLYLGLKHEVQYKKFNFLTY